MVEVVATNKKKWWKAREICPKTGTSITSTTRCLMKLRYSNSILFRTYDGRGRYEYRWKKPEKEITKKEVEEIWENYN